MKRSLQNSGQSSLEFILIVGFLLIPAVIAGGLWAKIEWKRSECALQAFKLARIQLLQTREKSVVTLHCGTVQETVTLLPLESLDQNGGGLHFGDIIKEASQLWEQLFSSSLHLPESD